MNIKWLSPGIKSFPFIDQRYIVVHVNLPTRYARIDRAAFAGDACRVQKRVWQFEDGLTGSLMQ